MRNRHGHCGCQQPSNEIVYPVKNKVVNCYSEETVKHVHPTHTTVKNHHIIKNEHVYPHSTSVENSVENINIPGHSANNSTQAGFGPNNNQVAGITNQGMGSGSHNHCHKSCNHKHNCHCRRRRRRGW